MDTPTATDAPATGRPGETLDHPIAAVSIEVATDAPATGPKRSVSEWATAKGMLPRFVPGKKSPRAKPKAKPPLVQNTKHIHFHKARAAHRWLVNTELTEAEFDKAIAGAGAFVYGQAPRIKSKKR